MKNTLAPLFLAVTMTLSTGCSTVREIQKRQFENVLSDQWPSKGENLAEAIKYLAAQEVSTSRQAQ